MSLAESDDRNPYLTVAMFSYHRAKGTPDEEIAKKLLFHSVEEMHDQLKIWEIPSWLAGEASETSSTPTRDQEKGRRRLKNFGPGTELPPVGNASELFKERLEALLERAELLKHMDESLHGRYFVHQDVETAALLLSRNRVSEEQWSALSERYGFDPDDLE
jgi:hypothetical protein